MKTPLPLVFAIALLVAVCTLPAQPFQVYLTVSASPDLQSTLESFLRRELRGLRDVELVSTNVGFNLSFIAFTLKNQGGVETGYTLSKLITYRSSPEERGLLLAACGVTNAEFLVQYMEQLVSIEDHALFVRPKDGLKSLTEEIVADFDTKVLERLRNFSRELRKVMQQGRTNAAPSRPLPKPDVEPGKSK
jgi:hypothetical protein